MGLKNSIKNNWFKLLPNRVVYEIQQPLRQQLADAKEKIALLNDSYSQEGEDLILQRLFGDKADGFYVDIGAHHPTRFSNTYHFYRKGWRGLNIDAMPGSMNVFKQLRPKDINLEIPVSDCEEELVYFIFNEKALNTFSSDEAQRKDGIGGYRIIERKKLKTRLLSDVLDEYLPTGKYIDFLTIDVEGLDFKVLTSNNWQKFRPTYILIEDLERRTIKNLINESEIYNLLTEKGYELIAKAVNTLFFKKL